MSHTVNIQIERLYQDLDNIEDHIDRLERQGNISLSDKVRQKGDYLRKYIERIS